MLEKEIRLRDLSLSAVIASGSAEDISRPPALINYSATPLAKRSLRDRGDLLEKYAFEIITREFSTYEQLWKRLIWDITDRDFEGGLDQPRAACSEPLRQFAEAQYTFLRSFLFCHGLLETPHLGVGHPLEPYFSNERFVTYYSHMGRLRDMACLMIEAFCRESGYTAKLRRGKDWDFGKIQTVISSRTEKATGDTFGSWNGEITQYRNLLHRTAHAIRYEQGKALVLKAGVLKNSKGWTDTLFQKQSDFLPAEEVMRKHFYRLKDWSSRLWEYFISEVDTWRIDPNKFASRLALPVAPS